MWAAIDKTNRTSEPERQMTASIKLLDGSMVRDG
jgi:hypothetical protein